MTAENNFELNLYEFNITDDFETILKEEFTTEEQKNILKKPSGLTEVLLLTSYKKGNRYRRLDFTGTTNEEAIKKILKFYKHKLYRRQVGDHIYFEGFYYVDMNEPYLAIRLGS